MSLRLGCASATIDVPLFTELYGYGAFLGRRNRGVHDPLYCRVASYSDGTRRIIMICNDLVVTDEDAAWEVRARLAAALKMEVGGIFVAGSHTHSGPAISLGIGWGELSLPFQRGWIDTAVATALQAVDDEEPVGAIEAGRAPLSQKLGKNRVQDDGPTDPDIRWARFLRADGSAKMLMHNHGMHGVVFGPRMLKVSADWMGAATQKLLASEVAEHVQFVYGAAGNVNTDPVGRAQEEGEAALERISDCYVADLLKGINDGQASELPVEPLSYALRRFELPTVPVTPEQLRADAAARVELDGGKSTFLTDRMIDMALYIEQGHDLDVYADLQALRIGDIVFYAFPGEPFVELGTEIMERSKAGFPVACAVANGNCRYFPTPDTFDRYPEGILSPKKGYGFYEIYQGCGRFMPVYERDIAGFLVDHLLEMGDM